MKYAIGIDVGATKIKGAVVDKKGKIKIRYIILTGARRKGEEILADIIGLIQYLRQESEARHLKLEGIGIGIPGVIKNGKLVFGGGTLIQLKGLDLANCIKKETDLKVILENDSKCFALAESIFSAGKKYKRLAGVIWGTGIGSSVIERRKNCIFAESVEMGHFVVEPNIKSEPKDACGQRGCVENLASGKNIERRYRAKGGKIKNAGVKEIYHSKEKVAKEVLEDAYKYLGMAIAALVRAASPEIIIIGGGVSNLPKPAHRKLKNYIYKYASEAAVKKLKIVKSKLGNFSGAIGAAWLALNE